MDRKDKSFLTAHLAPLGGKDWNILLPDWKNNIIPSQPIIYPNIIQLLFVI